MKDHREYENYDDFVRDREAAYQAEYQAAAYLRKVYSK